MDEMIVDSMTAEDEDLLRVIAEGDDTVPDTVGDVVFDDETHDGEPVVDYARLIGELEEKLREAEFEKEAKERELRCLSLLGEADLPAELMPVVILSEDVEGTVEMIRRTVRSLVDTEVSRRCRSDAPAVGTRAPISKEELMRMPVAEIQRLRNSGAVLG